MWVVRESIFFWLLAVPACAQTWRTDWLGNSLGGASGKWVQSNIAALAVGPDGTCCTDSFWDEGGHEAGIYRNSDLSASCVDMHGHGGFAVTVDGPYAWLAYRTEQKGGAVRRYDLKKGWPAPIRHDGKDEIGIDVTASINSLRGLAVLGDELFVSDFDANLIRVINTATLAQVRSIPFPRPQRLVGQGNDSLWVISARERNQPAKILRIARDGKPLPQKIEDVDDPVALAYDPAGRLLIADNGPDQQIKIYSDLNSQPRCMATLGEKGGIVAAPRGHTGPLRFNGLTGVGIDAAKKIYVSENGLGPHFVDHPGFGAQLEMFFAGPET